MNLVRASIPVVLLQGVLEYSLPQLHHPQSRLRTEYNDDFYSVFVSGLQFRLDPGVFVKSIFGSDYIKGTILDPV